jgi:hypothetical protein
MAGQTRSEGLTAWLNRQALLQPDGTYLVRPFRRLPIVYEVDPATKNRLIASQIRFGRFAMIVIVIFFLASQGQPWALTWGLLAFAVVIFGVGYGVPFFILRRSKRVPATRWAGPAIIDADDRFSPRTYLIMGCLSGGLALSVLYVEISSPGQTGTRLETTLALPTVLAVVFARRYWRTRHEQR